MLTENQVDAGRAEELESAVTAHDPEAIFLPIETTRDGVVNVYSRSQMMLFKARGRAKAELEAALTEPGLSEEEYRKQIKGSRRWRDHFLRPPPSDRQHRHQPALRRVPSPLLIRSTRARTRAWLVLCPGLAACQPSLEADTASGPLPSPERLSALTQQLTRLGPRLVTTPAEEAAAEIIESLLIDAGLEVSREAFTWDAWEPGEAVITVGDSSWDARPLSPSPSCTGLDLRLAAGTETDLTDAAALFLSGDGGRGDQYFSAVAANAAAMIRVTESRDHDGGKLIEVGHTFATSTLPSVAVDHEVGAVLVDALGTNMSLDIASTEHPDHVSHNIIGRIPGSGPDTIYLVAHYDSWEQSESAMDNALGVAMLVMLAEVLADQTPSSELVFIATSGEEQGLQGALAWATDHDAEIRAGGRLVITLDIPWSAEGDFFCAADGDWGEQMVALADAAGVEARAISGVSPASDHVPFQLRGLEALWCTRQPDRHYHTTADLHQWLDFSAAHQVWELHRQLIEGLSPQR